MSARDALIWWNSKEGKKRLFESVYANSFYALAHLFERQTKPTYCGVACAVMVLNALRLNKRSLKLEDKLDLIIPDAAGGGKVRFNCYTQLMFLPSPKIKNKVEGKNKDVFDPGFGLDDLAKKLRLFLLNAKVSHAKEINEKSLTRFRHDLMAHLNESRTFIIANFESKSLGREGGGHFSPIVAYHPATDSCLVMDVAGHKNPWFWVPLPKMFKAMHTLDDGKYRGYLIISDRLDAA